MMVAGWKVVVLMLSIIIFLMGAIPMAGYALDVKALYQPFTAVAMAPFTALGFMLCGLTFALLVLKVNGMPSGYRKVD